MTKESLVADFLKTPEGRARLAEAMVRPKVAVCSACGERTSDLGSHYAANADDAHDVARIMDS